MTKTATSDPVPESFAEGLASTDPIQAKLDLIIEELGETRELVEELVEKVADLEVPYNGGFRTYD